jgi:trans-2-enoyl-CoA reductase
VQNYTEITDKTVRVGNTPSEQIQMGSKDYCPMNVKKKILGIGDSHAKGLACNLSSHFGRDFEIMGTVMPGARL